ncbi:MAG: MBOAT family O-acyltransferase [Oscillospiraceae bacterium]
MVFSSVSFLFAFLPIVLLIYFAAPKKLKNLVILCASLIFYAWGEPIFVIVLIFSILFNYFFARLIDHFDNKKIRLIFFSFTIIVNISLIFLFKYISFFTTGINNIFKTNLSDHQLPIIMGISFFTLTSLSYIIDIYRHKVKPQKNIIDFAMYISLFSQIIAGPIVRYSDMQNQIKNRKTNYSHIADGISLFIRGLAKKLILADGIGTIWTSVKAMDFNQLPSITAWIGIVSFALQIYYDFSGYCDMALGISKMLGFSFNKNFDHPYMSKSITEFFCRWNITLNNWFKDYVYLPLTSITRSHKTHSGNPHTTKKSVLINSANLLIVWLLIGLWHGGSLNFILWGLYVGILIVCEKFVWGNLVKKLPAFFQWFYTFILTIFGFVIFAIPFGEGVSSFFKALFVLNNQPIVNNETFFILLSKVVILIICILGVSTGLRSITAWLKSKTPRLYSVSKLLFEVAVFLICICYIVTSQYNPFIYFFKL